MGSGTALAYHFILTIMTNADALNETRTLIDGVWVCARPINYKHRSLVQRIKEAYLVFKGTLEAVKFYKQ